MKLVRASLLAFTFLLMAPLLAAQPVMTPEQAQRWEKLAPGIPLTPALFDTLKEIVETRPLSVDERLHAISVLAGIDQLPAEQRIHRRICIWDLFGRSGPVFAAATEQKERARRFGIDLEMVPYTNESVLVNELKAGQCDAALMSGMRARLFNRFTGTLDALGAVPTERHLKTLLDAINHPSNAAQMVDDNFVVLGIFPAGTAYVFVNDRSITSLAKAAGKRVAVLDYDQMQARMVAGIGATPVPSDFVSAPTKFNNGVVDILAAPLVAYETLELYKGMTPNGGIVRIPLAQITMQLIGRSDKFPNEVAQLIRESALENYNQILSFVSRETEKVPEKWWIEVPATDRQEYEVMMQSARLTLRANDYYDANMLTLQRKVRCKFEPERAECAEPIE